MMQMSLTSYGDFLKENKLSTRTDDTRRVKEVGTRIAAAVEAYLKSQGLEKQIEGYQWEFNLVQSPEMNAWCMPGDNLLLFTTKIFYWVEELLKKMKSCKSKYYF